MQGREKIKNIIVMLPAALFCYFGFETIYHSITEILYSIEPATPSNTELISFLVKINYLRPALYNKHDY
jgi:hypothetical protein